MIDAVDDLHAAEDFAGACADVLERIRQYVILHPASMRYTEEGRELLALTELRVNEWSTYCRPSCDPNNDGPHDEVCDGGDTCGCPCRSRPDG